MKFILKIFLLIFVIIIFNSKIYANDYMSVELQKAIAIEYNQKTKNNEFSSIDECTNFLIESLNAIGIVSVKRINDLQIQEEIETICVFKKKVGAIDYNRCIHEQVYKKLGLEIIEIPLIINEEVEETTPEVVEPSTDDGLEDSE